MVAKINIKLNIWDGFGETQSFKEHPQACMRCTTSIFDVNNIINYLHMIYFVIRIYRAVTQIYAELVGCHCPLNKAIIPTMIDDAFTVFRL